MNKRLMELRQDGHDFGIFGAWRGPQLSRFLALGPNEILLLPLH